MNAVALVLAVLGLVVFSYGSTRYLVDLVRPAQPAWPCSWPPWPPL